MLRPGELIAPLQRALDGWPLLVVLVVGMVLVWVVVNGPWLFRSTRSLRRSFHCPFRGEDVDVDFLVAVWDGRGVDVAACSAFQPSAAVMCEKRCLGVTGSAMRRPARP